MRADSLVGKFFQTFYSSVESVLQRVERKLFKYILFGPGKVREESSASMKSSHCEEDDDDDDAGWFVTTACSELAPRCWLLAGWISWVSLGLTIHRSFSDSTTNNAQTLMARAHARGPSSRGDSSREVVEFHPVVPTYSMHIESYTYLLSPTMALVACGGASQP